MMGENQAPPGETNEHPQVAGRHCQVGLERKPAWDGLELTATTMTDTYRSVLRRGALVN